MDIYSTLAYPTGELPENPGPLSRFLPPVPEHVAPDFLKQYAEGGGWILDPFGASPPLVAEMARLGYRVLAAVNNPVTRFLLEMAAAAYPRAEFQAALAELAAARKGQERIESHLQSLYLGECTRCNRTISVDAFIWERGGETPVAKLIHCPTCNEGGERQLSSFDRRHASQMAATSGLHRSRALERVAPLGTSDRVHAEEALQYYPARAVYALITIINKLDSLPLSPERRRCLMALILSACDEANTLWPYPEERPRPRQLTVPPRYRENNVWLALERGVQTWHSTTPPIPLSIWPDLPPEAGGICLFEGPLRKLAASIKDIPFQAVLTALPRPNQAFWTLCALWSGWLWGRQAVQPFRMVLHRRRYDWNWHADALQSALKHLTPNLPLNAPLFAITAEPEPSFFSAAMFAAVSTGFNLGGVALRTKDDPAYLLWHRRAFTHTPTSTSSPDDTVESKASGEPETNLEPEPSDAQVAERAVQDFLTARAEPTTFLHLHAACLSALVEARSLTWLEEGTTHTLDLVHEALKHKACIHYSGTDNPETGLWGLRDIGGAIEPLPDRVEKCILSFLQENPDCTLDELETALNAELRGLLTPSLGLLHVVLDSYALEAGGRWRLRPEDDASTRREDLTRMNQILHQLGKRLGYTAVESASAPGILTWQKNAKSAYAFHLTTSAVVGEILSQEHYPAGKRLLVLPGGRAGLLAYKLERDPYLNELWSGGWRALKFRLLRRLAEMRDLTHDKWEDQLNIDPILQPEQMRLL